MRSHSPTFHFLISKAEKEKNLLELSHVSYRALSSTEEPQTNHNSFHRVKGSEAATRPNCCHKCAAFKVTKTGGGEANALF